MNLKAIIIEDEQDSQITLKNMLTQFCEGVEVVAIADSVSKAVSLIHQHQPDLIFLDIELPNEDGFSLFKYIPESDFEVVFTTAYNQYALKAFKLSAIDYLLKPIDLIELRNAIEQVKNRKILNTTQSKLKVLKENMNSLYQKLALPTQDGFSFVELKNILYCEAQGNYTKFFLQGEETILVSKTLKIYTDLLEEFNFFRVSRSFLINMNHIKKYGRHKIPTITMNDGQIITVSISQRDNFLNKIDQLL